MLEMLNTIHLWLLVCGFHLKSSLLQINRGIYLWCQKVKSDRYHLLRQLTEIGIHLTFSVVSLRGLMVMRN